MYPSPTPCTDQVGTAFAPLWMVWAFGLWGEGFLGAPRRLLTWEGAAVLVGFPVAIAVWLTTHKGHMPSDKWYRLGLALVSFGSCVAWIYVFAEVTVTLIEVREQPFDLFQVLYRF